MRFSEWEQNVAPKLMGPKVAAGDNKDAFNYLVQQAYCVRIIDNLYDQDYPPTNEELMDVQSYCFLLFPVILFIKNI